MSDCNFYLQTNECFRLFLFIILLIAQANNILDWIYFLKINRLFYFWNYVHESKMMYNMLFGKWNEIVLLESCCTHNLVHLFLNSFILLDCIFRLHIHIFTTQTKHTYTRITLHTCKWKQHKWIITTKQHIYK